MVASCIQKVFWLPLALAVASAEDGEQELPVSSFADLVLTPTVVRVGLGCAAAHLLLFALFSYVLPKGPWTDLPGFTAHQVVCLPLMIYLTFRGCFIWFGESAPDSFVGRALGSDIAGNPIGLAEVVVGELLFWDIPCGILVPALRDGLMAAHHVGMIYIAGVIIGAFSNGDPVGLYYCSFFLGVIEVSSVFLTFVDMFHPKHKPWFEYLENEKSPGVSILRPLNEFARMAFAVSFVVVRGIYFPYVIATGAVPDFSKAAALTQAERGDVPVWALLFIVGFAILFSLLQMYWGILVVRQIAKALGLTGSTKAKKGTSETEKKKER